MKKVLIVLAVLFSVLSVDLGAPLAVAQEASLQNHEKRLQAIEAYLDKLPPSMATYMGSMEESINKYTKDLESGLTLYSKRLEENLETQLMGISQKTIALNLDSDAFQKIDTSTGIFFISVQDTQPIGGGYRIYLQIGNPNYADFRDFSLRLVWGEKWSPKSKLTYEQWRSSLNGAKYSFKGELKKGTWNPIEVDLVPASESDLAYVECELGIGAIELEMR